MVTAGIGLRHYGIGLGAAAAFAAMRVVRSRYALYATSTMAARQLTPPVLPKRPQMVPFGKVPGQNRGENPMEPVLYLEDPYFYVRDDQRKNPEVLAHLRKENDYTATKVAHLTHVRENLYQELLSHVQETDEAYPYPYGPFVYYTRTVKGKSYVYHCRKPKNRSFDNAEEQLLLDVNELAEGQDHCDVSCVQVSPDHRYLAYMVDLTGFETYTGFIKDLETGKLLPDRLEEIDSLEWGQDSSEIFYNTQDEAHRCDKVWRHVVGSDEKDELLYQDDDEVYLVSSWKSRSGRFFFMMSSCAETTEISYIDFENRSRGVQCVQPRQEGLMYEIGHHEDRFYIVTNKDNAVNFKLMSAPVDSPSMSNWENVFEYDEAVKVDGIDCFKSFLMMSGRHNGLSQLWLLKKNANDEFEKERLEWEEPIYTVGSSVNEDYDTDKYRVTYASMTTPRTLFDFDVNTNEKKFLKERPVPNYDRTLYASERMYAKAEDGTLIPMSLVYRKDLRQADKPQPVHLYGYGSYEICCDPMLETRVLPLLDRGVIYVIAHIRGGGEMGRTWYENAKYLTKKKTFTDFINCAEHLINNEVTQSDMMTCEGRSAGGLLIGAVLNMRPDLFTAAIAGVPFVDVVNSMSDATIPLTTGEWKEWGNPNEAKYFQYMLSYSPYENVKSQAYPDILVTSGLYDPRVAYWEPTKWVAKLRDLKTDQNDVLLKMDLTSGHFSASDRYFYLREKAFDLAYLLDKLQRLTPDDFESPSCSDQCNAP